MTSPPAKPPSCMGCAHHYITHDPILRYGCRAFGFKSQQAPIRVVQDASARACEFFQPRPEKGPSPRS